MRRVLIDTDIFSELFKGRDVNVVARAAAYQQARGEFTISVITVLEITSGLRRVRAEKQFERFEAMLRGCEILPFTADAALLAGKIDADLRLRGTPVDLNDVMIAAIALGASTPVVTGNTAHFEAIHAAGYPLNRENWRER